MCPPSVQVEAVEKALMSRGRSQGFLCPVSLESAKEKKKPGLLVVILEKQIKAVTTGRGEERAGKDRATGCRWIERIFKLFCGRGSGPIRNTDLSNREAGATKGAIWGVGEEMPWASIALNKLCDEGFLVLRDEKNKDPQWIEKT